MVRNVIRHIAVFFAVCFLLLVMLTGAAKIHQSAIRGNMIESAEYMNEKPAAFRVFDRVQSSSLDWYADALLLNIAFNLDENKPLESAMLSAYSGYPNQHAAQYLLESARDGLEPRQEYIRYWHGSVVFVRLYHLLLNIQQIYYFHAIIIFLLTAVLVWILGKNKRIPEAACFLLSMA